MFGKQQTVNAHPLGQRLLRQIRRFSGASSIKSHEVHFLQLEGHTRKRVRFQHATEAMSVERTLEEFGRNLAVPACIFRQGSELWLEYVHGPLLDPRLAGSPTLVVDFFAELYRRNCREVKLASTTFPSRLERDVRFLAEAGILSSAATHQLLQRAAALQPETAWVGFDYIDPLPKNFVVRDGSLVGVDVEALQPGRLLGTGPAKAFLRWLSVVPAEFLRSLREAGAPDLEQQFEYVDLCFRCAYAKQKSFQRKMHLAPASIFDRFLTWENQPSL